MDASAEHRFWAWFQQNAARLWVWETGRVFDEVKVALREVHSGLTFEFGPVQGGRRTFVISANDAGDRFPVVQSLVAAAPAFDRWNIIAFRQPQPHWLSVSHQGHRLKSDDVWFKVEPETAPIRLTLAIRGMNLQNRQLLVDLGYHLVQRTLGEFLAATRVGSYLGSLTLPEDPAAEGFQPFASIQAAYGVDVHPMYDARITPFQMGAVPVGYFEGDPPAADGLYYYAPDRGSGQAMLLDALDQDILPVCGYTDGDVRVNFVVIDAPSTQVLQLTKFRTTPVEP